MKYITKKTVSVFGLLNKIISLRHPRRHTLCSIPPETNHDVEPTS